MSEIKGMSKIHLLITAVLIIFILNSCSKKHHPSKTPAATENTSIIEKRNDSALAKKTVVKKKAKVVLPNVIAVNDSAAHKSVDGRYYYDVMGHRYWRNNKDGKYYLFNKSMYNNPDFKKPG